MLRSKYQLMWVDAFTAVPFAGNPCAVVFEADALDEKAMSQIALEMTLPETAFVCKSFHADFRVKFFTPEKEIPLAGHPTIATVFALIDSGRYQPKTGLNRITLELRDGPIGVDISYHTGMIQSVTMHQRKPEFFRIYDEHKIARIFGLSAQDFLQGVPIQTVSTGTPMLMVPLKNLEALRRVELKFAEYREFREQADFFSPHFFCLGGLTNRAATFARHLNAPPDTVEDAFTGSATGCMAAYLWKYHLIQNPRFIAEQGHWMGRPGEATVEIVGPPEAMQAIKVGGQAARVFVGELEV